MHVIEKNMCNNKLCCYVKNILICKKNILYLVVVVVT